MQVAGESQEVPPGVRGVVSGFSRGSRRRLIEQLMRVDWLAVAEPVKKSAWGRAFFVSLTFPGLPQADHAKGCLAAFRRRLERRFGRVAVIWRMELQQRGAIHFHLAVFFPARVAWATVRDWAVSSWCEVVPGAAAAAQDVRAVYGGGSRLLVYLSKYLAKLPAEDAEYEPVACGRWWGIWRSELVSWADTVQLELSPAETLRLLRRIRARGRRLGSRFLAELRPWQGAIVYGDAAELVEELLE